jgi:hypothetical protein
MGRQVTTRSQELSSAVLFALDCIYCGCHAYMHVLWLKNLWLLTCIRLKHHRNRVGEVRLGVTREGRERRITGCGPQAIRNGIAIGTIDEIEGNQYV